MNETINSILKRQSCKSFDESKPLKKEDIEAIVKCACFAPSAMNTQAWHFTVITKKGLIDEMNGAVYQSVDDESKERIMGRNPDFKFRINYSSPVFIIVSCSDASPFPYFDCACALENMFLAATSLSIGSCWINQLTTPRSENPAIRAFLDKVGVPKENKVYGCCALGYPKNTPPQKERAKNTITLL